MLPKMKNKRVNLAVKPIFPLWKQYLENFQFSLMDKKNYYY